ncbi:hypothetical protein Pan216_29390 [Planctomycetes bacterium Pan216]|uniref:DUF11 domain-containing protein n=1 Tax=Kolteria novifilia TaxID=2527975 RepID=A0A518B529_9BACT|nr:hypothetical protein Pan216_29390 [Planctomycetes bacterium Pan216]
MLLTTTRRVLLSTLFAALVVSTSGCCVGYYVKPCGNPMQGCCAKHKHKHKHWKKKNKSCCCPCSASTVEPACTICGKEDVSYALPAVEEAGGEIFMQTPDGQLLPMPNDGAMTLPPPQCEGCFSAPSIHIESVPDGQPQISHAPPVDDEPRWESFRPAPKPEKSKPAPKSEPKKTESAQKQVKPRKGSLALRVSSDPGLVAVGEEITFELTLLNEGNAPIERVDLAARVSENVDITSIKPAKTGTSQGGLVTFEPITNLMPTSMPLRYQIVGKALRPGAARISVEAGSSVLSSGPLTREAATQVTDDEEPGASTQEEAEETSLAAE